MRKLLLISSFFVLLLVSSVLGVMFEIDKEELIFDFNGELSKEGIVVLETDTEPLLVSITNSNSLKRLIGISSGNDLRVSKTEPLVLKLNLENPGKGVDGFLTINLLYETLPEEINYYGDDTIRIPIKITQGSDLDVTKVTVSLTEKLPPGVEVTPLSTGVILPIIVLIALLLIFRKKWRRT